MNLFADFQRNVWSSRVGAQMQLFFEHLLQEIPYRESDSVERHLDLAIEIADEDTS